MTKRNTRPIWAAGIIERGDNHVLITTDAAAEVEERFWFFPRGPVQEGESPEAGLRRIAEESLDLRIEIIVGQPPLLATIAEEEIELRYFFCGVAMSRECDDLPDRMRWVPRAHLREYTFDPPSNPVVDWLIEHEGW